MRPVTKRRKKRVLTPLGRVCVTLLIILLIGVMLFVGRLAIKRALNWYYPMEYSAEVDAAAEEFDVPPSLIYAVIHTESRFEPTAQSHAGAKGLMQLTDATYEWIGWRLKENTDDKDAMLDPAVNIRYGTYLLSYLTKEFSDPRAALAAYNAGAGRVRGWLASTTHSADGVTLDTIPYEETRDYVERVNTAREYYQKTYGLP